MPIFNEVASLSAQLFLQLVHSAEKLCKMDNANEAMVLAAT